MTAQRDELPLQSLRVLEFGHIVAGPTAGLVLSELGADVIKVEPHGGEQARGMTGLGAGVFPFLNRGKRTVALDLKDRSGRDKLEELLAGVDVVLSNYSRSAGRRLRIDYESIREINDQVIFGQIAGFGSQSEYADRPALDEVVQMMCGLAHMTGPAGRPLRAGASVVDIGAALFLAIGVLSALRRREETGEGCWLESTLYGAGLFYMGTQMATHQITGQESLPFPEHGVGRRYGWPVYDLFRARAGEQVFVAATSERHWADLAEMIGATHFVQDPRYRDHDGRVRNRDTVLPVIQEWIGNRSIAEVESALEGARLPFAPVRSPDDVLLDSKTLDGLDLVDTGVGDIKVPPLPLEGSWNPPSGARGVPRLEDDVVWLPRTGRAQQSSQAVRRR